jgi:hypothetical protein
MRRLYKLVTDFQNTYGSLNSAREKGDNGDDLAFHSL